MITRKFADLPDWAIDQVRLEDCVAGMKRLPSGSIDLAFADPPFNIGYEYDEYDDRRDDKNYLDWSRQWAAEVVRLLKPDGTFWLAMGDGRICLVKGDCLI